MATEFDEMVFQFNQNLKACSEKSLRNEEKIKKVFKGVIKMMIQTFKKLNDLESKDESYVIDKFINAYFSGDQSRQNQQYGRCPQPSGHQNIIFNSKSLFELFTTFKKFAKK